MDNNHEYSVAFSDVGEIVRDELLRTSQIRPNVELDEWIIMPNHIHVIFVINNDNKNNFVETAPPGRLLKHTEEMLSDVLNETPHRGRLYTGERGFRHDWHKPEWKSNSLGSMVNQFKSVCTKQIRKINPSFGWQPRFYDHIIRNELLLHKIRAYIKNNLESLIM